MRVIIFAIFCLQLASTSVWGASVSITPVIVAAYHLDGSPASVPPNFEKAPMGRHIFEAAFFLTVSHLAAGEQGFGNAAFAVHLAGAISRASAPFPIAYSPLLQVVDHDGSSFTAAVPLFADNSDFGDPQDLVDVVVGVDPFDFVTNDPRLRVGQDGAVRLGSLFFEFNPTSLGLTGALVVSFTDASVVANGGLEPAIDPVLTGGSLAISAVPEPNTLTLMLLGAAALMLSPLRRRLTL